MKKLPDKRFLLIIFSYLLFFILIPPFQIPDESTHYENVFWVSQLKYPYIYPKDNSQIQYFHTELTEVYDTKKIIENPMAIPDFEKIKNTSLKNKKYYSSKEISKFSQISPQGGHPPLFYLLASFFFRLANFFNLGMISQFYLVRLTSTIFYFGTILVAYQILNILLKNKDVAKNLLLFFSLNPLMIKTGVGINHDISLIFFSLLFLLLFLKFILKKRKLFWDIFFISLSTAAAGLSKLHGVFTAIVFGGGVFLKEKINKKSFKKIFQYCLVLLPFITWWLIFTYRRYQQLLVVYSTYYNDKPLQPNSFFKALILAALEFRHTMMHFSGFMGWNEVYPFKWFFYLYTFLFVILLFFGVIRFLKRRTILTDILLIYIFSLALVLFAYGIALKKAGLSWDIQGRYLLPAFLPIVYFMAQGLSLLLRRKIEVASEILALFAIFHFNFILFFVLFARYYV